MLSSIFIWKPQFLQESIDGKPLAISISQLFHEFPYNRLPINPAVAIWMHPIFVFTAIVFYLVSIPLLRFIIEKLCGGGQYGFSKSIAFRNFVAIHNLALAIFSGVCAWNVWLIAIDSLTTQRNFLATYCDPDGSLWNKNGLGAWATSFYISKYYEFVDTWILIAKGKDASFLQVYHHAGIAFIFWAAVASQGAWMIWGVMLNSTIHTFMYTYFFIKTLSPKVEIKAAKYLTMAQIGQFILGICISSGVLFLGESCDTQSSRFALACLDIYGLGLIALFVAFANRKYKTN